MKDWIEECFDWFDDRFEPPETPILPTKSFFKAGGGESEETARQVLKDVTRLLHFDAPIDLIPLDLLSAEYRLDYNSTSAVAGTYQNDGETVVIRYDPELLKSPLQFINILAHEVMHARLSGLEDEVPGGAGAHELSTDLGCIIAGFGVFQLQGADDAGWAGYLSQDSRAHALALFLKRRGLGRECVSGHLTPRCQKLLTRAIKALL
ncbi:hypothetical protein [Pseudophaeobacter sp.]|uniref:hypothetical protein n=1 Tax=Pseudophaeobacter sp. TaxID=1971739 RepID=UPI00329835DA